MVGNILECAVVIFVSVALLPVFVLACECLGALIPHRPERGVVGVAAGRPQIAVLIPAHNEAVGIGHTLSCLAAQLGPTDRLIVVADNCTDGTADLARASGAEVVERFDAERRGKGYALDVGIRHLCATPPEVLIIVDADCECMPGAVDSLAAAVARSGHPQQAAYVMELPSLPSPADRVSAFAFRVKNLVRPLGLRSMGLPCLLTGTGMAFPWRAIAGMPLASGNIVEDMQLGLDLAVAGCWPQFCAGATVVGRLPGDSAAASAQRTRWEHGHMGTMLRQAPRLVVRGLRAISPRLIALGLELAVPPLSLLVLAWLGVTVLSIGTLICAGWYAPVVVVLAGWLLLVTSIATAWWRHGRDVLPLRSLLFIPAYIVRKIPRFVAFVTRRQREWVRTARET